MEHARDLLARSSGNNINRPGTLGVLVGKNKRQNEHNAPIVWVFSLEPMAMSLPSFPHSRTVSIGKLMNGSGTKKAVVVLSPGLQHATKKSPNKTRQSGSELAKSLCSKKETCVCVCVYFKQSSCPAVTGLCCSVGVIGRDRRTPDAR